MPEEATAAEGEGRMSKKRVTDAEGEGDHSGASVASDRPDAEGAQGNKATQETAARTSSGNNRWLAARRSTGVQRGTELQARKAIRGFERVETACILGRGLAP